MSLKDEQFDELYLQLKDYIINYTPSNYKLGSFEPDVIYSPKVIINIKSFFICLNPSSMIPILQMKDNRKNFSN